VVSGDENGVIGVWNVLNGQQVFRFADASKQVSKLTAMCFDDGGRRLVTGI
jgi:WD40 repeat protein